MTTTTRIYVGRVKWFNNRAGYGFITVSGEDNDGTDVFAHHSALSVDKEQYRFLVQGEYVHFDMSEMKNGDHKWQASNVRGINNGPLMCETKHEAREHRLDSHDTSNREDYETTTTYRTSDRRPLRGRQDENKAWELVKTGRRRVGQPSTQ